MGKVKGIIRVIHLIPHDGIGGVESAARTLNFINKKNLHFFVKYIYKPKDKKINYHLYSPFPIIYAAFQCVKTPPDFLISSTCI